MVFGAGSHPGLLWLWRFFGLRAHGDGEEPEIAFEGKDVSSAVGLLQSRRDVDPEGIGVMGVLL